MPSRLLVLSRLPHHLACLCGRPKKLHHVPPTCMEIRRWQIPGPTSTAGNRPAGAADGAMAADAAAGLGCDAAAGRCACWGCGWGAGSRCCMPGCAGLGCCCGCCCGWCDCDGAAPRPAEAARERLRSAAGGWGGVLPALTAAFAASMDSSCRPRVEAAVRPRCRISHHENTTTP